MEWNIWRIVTRVNTARLPTLHPLLKHETIVSILFQLLDSLLRIREGIFFLDSIQTLRLKSPKRD